MHPLTHQPVAIYVKVLGEEVYNVSKAAGLEWLIAERRRPQELLYTRENCSATIQGAAVATDPECENVIVFDRQVGTRQHPRPPAPSHNTRP